MNINKSMVAFIKNDISTLALVGIAIRIVLIPFFIWPHDIVAQQLSLIAVLNHHDPYSLSFSMYPPFIYMLFHPLLLIASEVGLTFKFYIFPVTFNAGMHTDLITSYFGDPTFLAFWKSPLLFFDLLTGLLMYRLTKELTMDSSKAKKGFVLWFFNPFVLITSYIHGAFDVIVVFFILMGIYLLSKKRYWLSGISFGLGGITKISPLLTAIPLSTLIFFGKTSESLEVLSRKRFFTTATFLAGCMIPILISIFWNLNYYNLLAASTLNELSINGGINQWFFAANSDIRSVFFTPNINALAKIIYFYPIISFIPLLAFRRHLWNFKLNLHVILLVSALSLVIVYFVSPATICPQYILWLIPILTILSMKNRSFHLPLAILSFAASAFFFSIQSVFAFMYPLALFTQTINVNQLNAIIVNYSRTPGTLCTFLREDLCYIFGAIGFLGQVVTIVLVVRKMEKAVKDVQN